MLIENLPSEYHGSIKRFNEPRLKKMMEILRDRVKLPTELNHYTYFFEAPELTAAHLNKPLSISPLPLLQSLVSLFT